MSKRPGILLFFQAVFVTAIVTCADTSRAVIIALGDGSGNTTAPGGGVEWDNVGIGGSGSTALYLGNGRVLTASHLGVNTVNLGGIVYNAVPDSEVRLTNGGVTFTDLLIYQIDGDPGLPTLDISTIMPSLGTTVFMIGHGSNREADLTEWNTSMSEGNWIWSEVPAGAYSGYKWASGGTKRWGTNQITENDVVINAGYGNVTSVRTTFTEFPGTSEAQAAVGDSGGGMFAFNPGTLEWDLVGVMVATSAYHDQPADTSMFGNSTYAADVSYYRDQIIAMRDGPHVDGDINRDGVVDLGDFTLWGDAFGAVGTSPADVSGDGEVDIGDFTVWADNFTGTAGVAALGIEAADEVAVPEPSTWLLLAIGGGLLYAFASRQKRKGQ